MQKNNNKEISSSGLESWGGGGGGGGRGWREKEGDAKICLSFFQYWFTNFTLLFSNVCHLIEFGQLSFVTRVQQMGSWGVSKTEA